MSRTLARSIVVLLTLAFASCASDGGPGPLDSMHWILGEWRADAGNELVIEKWRLASDVTFEGTGLTLNKSDKSVKSEETLRLVTMGGEVFYLAKVPENDLPVPFKMTSHKDGKAIFENPDRDFPNKLIYHRIGMNALEVDVLGRSEAGFTLHFKR